MQTDYAYPTFGISDTLHRCKEHVGWPASLFAEVLFWTVVMMYGASLEEWREDCIAAANCHTCEAHWRWIALVLVGTLRHMGCSTHAEVSVSVCKGVLGHAAASSWLFCLLLQVDAGWSWHVRSLNKNCVVVGGWVEKSWFPTCCQLEIWFHGVPRLVVPALLWRRAGFFQWRTLNLSGHSGRRGASGLYGGDAMVEVGSPITSATGPNPPIVGGLHGLKLLVILHLWFVIKSNVSIRLPRKMCLGWSAFGSPCFIQPAAQPRQLRSKEFPAWPGHRVGWGGEIGYPVGNVPKIDK